MPDIELFYLDLTRHDAGSDEPFMHTILDSHEHERYHRFKHEGARTRFLMTRWLIKNLLCERTGKDPKAIVFSYNKYGKPSLQNNAEPHFSLAHSDNTIAIAISEASVGVDVESYTRRGEPWGNIAAFLNEAVASRLPPASSIPSQQRFFARYWTAMEALVKMNGSALYIEKESFAQGFCIDTDRGYVATPSAHFYHAPIASNEHICISSECRARRIAISSVELVEARIQKNPVDTPEEWHANE